MSETISKESLSKLNDLLSNTDLSKVTSEGAGFEDLKEGYYRCEVKKAELTTSKSSGSPMVALQLAVVDECGYYINDEDELVETNKVKGRRVFKYYVFSDANSVTRFVSDMLKFEGENPNEPLLPKEAWMSAETLEDSIAVLQELGPNIWIFNQKAKTKDPQTGNDNYFTNLISWNRASKLGLPE